MVMRVLDGDEGGKGEAASLTNGCSFPWLPVTLTIVVIIQC